MQIGFLGILALALFATPTLANETQDAAERLRRMMSWEPVMDAANLEKALTKAKASPLGSRENPVRAESPIGQRAYLRRLRCADGHEPYFSRLGNFGPGVYGSIIDGYVVDCGASAPGQISVTMDMYFKGHVEKEAVPGFAIVPPPGDQ